MADLDPELRHGLNNLLARMLAAAEAGLISRSDAEMRAELETIVALIEVMAEAIRPAATPNGR